jgi:hypothetical protein
MQRTDRVLKRAFGLYFCFLALLVYAAGTLFWYVAWLRRFHSPEQQSTFNHLFVVPWVVRPLEGALAVVLAILSGTIVWSAVSLVTLFRTKRGAAAAIVDAHRVHIIDRLKIAALWAMCAGVYMGLLHQLLLTTTPMLVVLWGTVALVGIGYNVWLRLRPCCANPPDGPVRRKR